MQLSPVTADEKTDLDERRDNPRFICNRPAFMTTTAGSEHLPVLITDVGRDGFGLRVPIFIAPGGVIQIHLTSSIAVAEVRYCVEFGPAFAVGVNVRQFVAKQ
jgi:hypothetical protein